MYVDAGSPNKVYPALVQAIRNDGVAVGPRGTQTLELSPAILELDPTNPFVTSWGRPINVAFALAEVLWILRGRRDVEMPAFYNESIRQFSDDGLVFNAPYGYRLRGIQGYDQIEDVLLTLTADRDSRQGTLCIWHQNDRGWAYGPEYGDIPIKLNRKDRACNIVSHVMIRDDKLNWMQVVRSNDVILGVPYNFVQFTALQSYMAGRLGIEPGKFTYIADSMHLYTDGRYYPADEAARIGGFDLYAEVPAEPMPLIGHSEDELCVAEKCEEAIRNASLQPTDDLGPFWDNACWLFAAHREYREHNDDDVLEMLIENVHPIPALIQMKFYYLKRWFKDKYEHLDVLNRVEDRFGSVPAMWLTDFAHVTG